MKLRFREFVLDTTARVLLRAEVELAVQPLVFDCIELLASRSGVLVRTDELRSRLWPSVHVADSATRRVINEARHVLGDSGEVQQLIRTRKGLGYVFVAAVVTDPGTSSYDPLRAWPFVGRAHELDVLSRWLDRSSSGGLCLISGEAGAGKSSLLVRLRQQSAQRRVWLLGQCHAGPEQPAFWPFREIARQLLAQPALRAKVLRLARGKRGLTAAIPELAPAEAGVQQAVPRFEACEAWAGLLAELARVQPLQIVLEDMHWADDGSVWMLAALARAAQRSPLYVIVTYRSEALSQARTLAELIARVSGREGLLDVSLAGLNQAAIEALLGELAFPGATARLAADVLRSTSGNALFVREMVRHALATSSDIGASLPASFSHIVAERISLVPERTRLLLELAAVLGCEFEIELLGAVADSATQAVLLAELEPALRAGLLRTLAESPHRLMFSHALICEALVRGLPTPQRQAHHLAALCALVSQPSAANLAALANHAFEAGGAVPAEERRRLCERAGRDAFERLGFDRAALQLGRAVSLLAPDDASAEAAELTLLWAKARWHADDPEREVGETLLAAADRARRADQPQLLAEAAVIYAVGDESLLDNRIAFLRPDAYGLAEEAWRGMLRAAGGDVARLSGDLAQRLATVLCWFRVDSCDVEPIRRWAQLAQRLAPAKLKPARRALLLGLGAVAQPAEAERLLAELATHVRKPGRDVREGIEGRIMLMALYLLHADLAQYERVVREIEQLARPLADAVRVGRLGDRMSTYLGVALLAQVTQRVIRGQLADAAEQLVAVPNEAARLGLLRTRRVNINTFAIWRWLAAYRGHSQALEPSVDERVRADPSARWFGVFFKLQFALQRGALDVAAEHYRELSADDFQPRLRGQPQPANVTTLVEIADACAQVGSAVEAAVFYERLLPHAALVVVDGTMICWGACARVLGRLAMQLGRYAEAEQHFQQALGVNTRLGHQPELVRTQAALAGLLQRTGRRAEAEQLSASARARAAAIGMAGFAHEFAVRAAEHA